MAFSSVSVIVAAPISALRNQTWKNPSHPSKQHQWLPSLLPNWVTAPSQFIFVQLASGGFQLVSVNLPFSCPGQIHIALKIFHLLTLGRGPTRLHMLLLIVMLFKSMLIWIILFNILKIYISRFLQQIFTVAFVLSNAMWGFIFFLPFNYLNNNNSILSSALKMVESASRDLWV